MVDPVFIKRAGKCLRNHTSRKAAAAFVRRNEDAGQPAREMGPYLAYLDVAHRFALVRPNREDLADMQLLGALEVAFQLGVGQRVAEERCAPFDEIVLGWQPRD